VDYGNQGKTKSGPSSFESRCLLNSGWYTSQLKHGPCSISFGWLLSHILWAIGNFSIVYFYTRGRVLFCLFFHKMMQNTIWSDMFYDMHEFFSWKFDYWLYEQCSWRILKVQKCIYSALNKKKTIFQFNSLHRKEPILHKDPQQRLFALTLLWI
jgi:hypothetical protein